MVLGLLIVLAGSAPTSGGGGIDPTLGTIVVSALGVVGGIVIAIVQGRNSAERIANLAERLADQDQIRRLKRRLVDVHGEDPDDVDNL